MLAGFIDLWYKFSTGIDVPSAGWILSHWFVAHSPYWNRRLRAFW